MLLENIDLKEEKSVLMIIRLVIISTMTLHLPSVQILYTSIYFIINIFLLTSLKAKIESALQDPRKGRIAFTMLF